MAALRTFHRFIKKYSTSSGKQIIKNKTMGRTLWTERSNVLYLADSHAIDPNYLLIADFDTMQKLVKLVQHGLLVLIEQLQKRNTFSAVGSNRIRFQHVLIYPGF